MFPRTLLSLLALVAANAAVSGQADPVKDFERRLSDPAAKDQVRSEMLKFIGTAAGTKHAERVLTLLLKLPPVREAPTAPAFPFDAAAAGRYQKAYAEAAGLPVRFRNDCGLIFVLVPPGTFSMGSPESEAGRGPGER